MIKMISKVVKVSKLISKKISSCVDEKTTFWFKKVAKKNVGKQFVCFQKIRSGYKVFIGSAIVSFRKYSEVQSFIKNFEAISAQ